MATDLERAYEALNGKLLNYSTLFAYADGVQPTVYSTDRLREAFGNIRATFTQNWCSVVINAVLDRLMLKGFDAQDEAENNRLDDLWNRLRMNTDSYDAHYDALVTTEGFLILGRDGDRIDAYRNDPRSCHMFYHKERPKEREFATKWWDDDGIWNIRLYYPNRLELYQARSKDRPSSAGAFTLVSQEPNPYDEIPVFHLRCRGEMDNIITLQDAVNKLFADMMVSAEFAAFKQRYIISNMDVSAIENAPYKTWILPGGDGTGQETSVGQFDATPLNTYLDAINDIANAIAIISRTPKHYFYNASGQLSGEALLAMEAPLSRKVEQYQNQFGGVWRDVGAFLLRLDGSTKTEANSIVPIWQPSESVQPFTEAQTRQVSVSSGVPLITQLRWEGKSQEEIDAMLKDRDEEENAAYQNTPEQ